MNFYCPYCSMSTVYVGCNRQLMTGTYVTVIHCNKCNKTSNLLGVKS